MEIEEIDSGLDLLDWLKGRPAEWTILIPTRASLRALANLASSGPLDASAQEKEISCFRTSLLSWAAGRDPEFDNSTAINAAFRNSIDNTGRVRGDGVYDGDLSKQVNQTITFVELSVSKAMALWAIESSSERSVKFAKECIVGAVDFAAMSALDVWGEAAERAMWAAIQNDCKRLESQNETESQIFPLLTDALWLSELSNDLHQLTGLFSGKLLAIDPNYSVWIDWYQRRIRGERAAFDIPGDKRRVEDKKILRRLAEATNEDFWGKGHEYVNATLKGWLNEARARVAPSDDSGVATDVRNVSASVAIGSFSGAILERVSPVIPPQNRNAISFLKDDDGRIAIDTTTLADQMLIDAGAQDRHAEAVREARRALDRCQGNNAAARLTAFLSNYLEAAGESIEAAKPSLLVQRGERLRQELKRYEAPDHMLPPVADDLLLDMKGWQSAHNMVIGLDPVLNAMDTAMLGPDRRPSLITPDEIKRFVNDARKADLLAEGVEDILIETADLAPIVPDPTDRRTNASIEMVRNLCIETVSIVLNNPVKTGAIVTAFAVEGFVVGISIMGTIEAAKLLVAHRQWIEDKMGNTPTWKALFLKVADWLETNTPFKPK